MKVLDRVNSIEDLKKLNKDELPQLCDDIRQFLVQSVANTGGHLASNLGVVELTVAMHYVYNSPQDKFVFDVGHQAYVHKILTGRKNEFKNLRKYKGLSGFPKAEESVHDAFDTGHSTTSISAALGYAIGRDLKGEKNKVVAIIGDGSFTGGMAYEALNNAGKSQTDLIVVLNDNNMSISQNVGALANNLNKMRMSTAYNEAKTSTKNVITRVFEENSGLQNVIMRTKNRLRNALYTSGGFFEELGFKYYGKIDGNNVLDLVEIFSVLENLKRPILLHIDTKKGLGYKYSEENPEAFHGTPRFDINTGSSSKSTGLSYSKCFGDKLCDLASRKENIVAVTAAMAVGTGLSEFGKKYPERLFDVGIAEQHAVTFASGLSKTGAVPFVAIYSTFLQRAYDQIIHDVAITNQKVIFCIDRAGLVGEDGETHQGVFDIGYLINIPNMVIMSPANAEELQEMVELAYNLNSPVAIRYPRGNVPNPVYNNEKVEFKKSQNIYTGGEIAIVAVGNMLETAVTVAQTLKVDGIEITVVNPRFLKPVDENLIESLDKYKKVFVLEDGQRINGFGAYLQSLLNEQGKVANIQSLGYEDRFTNQGSIAELQKEHNIDPESIVNIIKNCI